MVGIFGIWSGYSGDGREMVGIWSGYGRDKIGIRSGYGRDMVGIWSGYGRDMVGIWSGDGREMIGGGIVGDMAGIWPEEHVSTWKLAPSGLASTSSDQTYTYIASIT